MFYTIDTVRTNNKYVILINSEIQKIENIASERNKLQTRIIIIIMDRKLTLNDSNFALKIGA